MWWRYTDLLTVVEDHLVSGLTESKPILLISYATAKLGIMFDLFFYPNHERAYRSATIKMLNQVFFNLP